MLRVRLVGPNQTLIRNLLRDSAPPTNYRWSNTNERADLTILIVPHLPDPAMPRWLSVLRPRDWRNLFIFSQEDRPVAWAPGVFASLDKCRASAMFAGGFFVPEHHFEPHDAGRLLDDIAHATSAREHLWSFVGSVMTCPAVRGQILDLPTEGAVVRDTSGWNREPDRTDFAEMAKQAVSSYVGVIARSKFVLAPRGVGPSTIRLFEAMRAGRAPVIISDSWFAPPFVDWDSCSIRIPEARLSDLPAILREREPEADALGRRARVVWQQHFSPENAIHTVVRCCLDLHARRPSRLMRLRCATSAWARRETVSRVKVLLRERRKQLREGHARSTR